MTTTTTMNTKITMTITTIMTKNDHNSPFSHRHLVYPRKFGITIASNLLGITVVLREIEDNGYALFFLGGGGGGINKAHHGLCENGERPQRQQ